MQFNLLAKLLENLAVQADRKKSEDEKNASNDAFKKAKELVVNELLAKFPAAKTATTAATGEKAEGGGKGSISVAIREIILAEVAAGKTLRDAKKAAVEAGYSDKTVGTIATAMKKEGLVSE